VNFIQRIRLADQLPIETLFAYPALVAGNEKIAAARGLTVVGILGILLESYRQRRINDPLEILAELRANRFYISLRLIGEFERLASLIQNELGR